MSKEYWRICAENASDEIEVLLSNEKLDALADVMQRSAEMESEYCGHHFIPNPEVAEIKKLESLLIAEREKVTCKTCKGSGELIENSGPWVSRSQCYKCHGQGRHKP